MITCVKTENLASLVLARLNVVILLIRIITFSLAENLHRLKSLILNQLRLMKQNKAFPLADNIKSIVVDVYMLEQQG